MTPADTFRTGLLHHDDEAGIATLPGRRLAAKAAEASANQPATTTPHQIGTQRNDTFHLTMPRLAQVPAGNGHDHPVIVTAASLGVIGATTASTRIVDAASARPRILDLLRVEALILGPGHDVVPLAIGVTMFNTRAGDGRISGDAGHDGLHGSVGHDIIAGGRGPDRVIGGARHDTMSGCKGANVLVFSAASGHRRLTDLIPALERIALDIVIARNVSLRQSGLDLLVLTDTRSLRIMHLTLADPQVADLLFV